jgi:hypothetical protein
MTQCNWNSGDEPDCEGKAVKFYIYKEGLGKNLDLPCAWCKSCCKEAWELMHSELKSGELMEITEEEYTTAEEEQCWIEIMAS